MPRPGDAPNTYEKKKTLEEYQKIYPSETTSLLDLYHAYHRFIKNKNKKIEIYHRNKSKTDTEGSETS